MREQVCIRRLSHVREVSGRTSGQWRGGCRCLRQRRCRRTAGPAHDAQGMLRLQPSLHRPPAAALDAGAAAHGQGPRGAQSGPRVGRFTCKYIESRTPP